MPYYSNEEIKKSKSGNNYKPAWIDENNICQPPECCGVEMKDDGGCSTGCCDDYKCENCNFTVRIEWPD